MVYRGIPYAMLAESQAVSSFLLILPQNNKITIRMVVGEECIEIIKEVLHSDHA